MENNTPQTYYVDLERIKQFGALNYSAAKIAILMHLDAEWLHEQLNDHTTDICRKYYEGKYGSEFNMDIELIKKVQDGDVEASAHYYETQRKRRVSELKKQLFDV